VNIEESRQFVVKHPPTCCGEVREAGYNITNKKQYFFCNSCRKSFEVYYWPLYESDIRELKLNKLLNYL
jgi:transposase-like protein